MATVDLRVGGPTAGQAAAFGYGNAAKPVQTGSIKLDFATTNRGASDVLQVLDVPAGSVLVMAANVTTAEGGVATADIGWVADPNGLFAALDLNAADTDAAPGGSVMQFFPSDAVVSVTLSAAVDAAVLDLHWALMNVR